MKFTILKKANARYRSFFRSLWEYFVFLSRYIHRKLIIISVGFEKYKNRLVKLFLIKRGRYNRPFLHFATMVVLFVGVLIGPFLADTYPIFASNTESVLGEQQIEEQSIESSDIFETKESVKPRDKILTYTVQKGDTVSTIAHKFKISADTIRWANNLSSDSLAIGDQLQILPVTGIAHKVASGQTVYSIAKLYDTEPQKIVDFPFNDFENPETFSLIQGQMLIVPDGIKPSERPVYRPRQPVYVAQGPVTISSSGFTWPLRGGISQFASWYHQALDITSPVGTPIVAAQNGKVSKVSLGTWDGGYGNNVYVIDSNGMGSHYAHMSTVNVSEGDEVVAGKTVIGYVGMTGRTTGPHLHFEIISNGTLVNPLNYLQ